MKQQDIIGRNESDALKSSKYMDFMEKKPPIAVRWGLVGIMLFLLLGACAFKLIYDGLM